MTHFQQRCADYAAALQKLSRAKLLGEQKAQQIIKGIAIKSYEEAKHANEISLFLSDLAYANSFILLCDAEIKRRQIP